MLTLARYEVRYGKFGAYVHDTALSVDMTLVAVLRRLNCAEEGGSCDNLLNPAPVKVLKSGGYVDV